MFPKLQATAINSSLQTRIERLKREKLVAVSGITWALNEGGLVVLRGEVESERARKMAELIVRLEPGVRAVQNELTVKAESSTE